MNTKLDNILRDWSQTKLPDEAKREKLLRDVLGQTVGQTPEQTVIEKHPQPNRRHYAAWFVAATSVAVAILFAVLMTTPQPPQPLLQQDIPLVVNIAKSPIYVSLLILRHISDSDFAVEFLEDTVLVTEDQKVNEIDLNGHKFYLWLYALEPNLFTFDVAINNVTETGLTALDKTYGLHLKSNENEFDVFVSLLNAGTM
jgi:hypothetical protein